MFITNSAVFLIIGIITTIIGTLILVTDYKTEWTRYLVCALYFGALASWGTAINDYANYSVSAGISISWETLEKLYRISAYLIQLSEFFIVFLILMYCISFSRLFAKKHKKFFLVFFFILFILAFLNLPLLINRDHLPRHIFTSYYLKASILCIPCILTSLAILLISYIRERNPGIRRQKFFNVIIGFPIGISVSINIFLIRGMGMNSGVKLNLIIICIGFILFFFLSFRYGAFGVRFRLERHVAGSSFESMSTGTAIFNHALKNEVNKIAMSTLNIKNLYNTDKLATCKICENIDILENSSNHLRRVISRLKDFSEEVRLVETAIPISKLLNQAVLNIKPYIYEIDIKVLENFQYDIHILGDEDHLIEAITNILKNACEAFSKSGIIDIDLYGSPKNIYIAITDNGPGIKREYLSKVFDPFFSTKKYGNENFGLGLSYCCKVMQKHNCDINIYSNENIGTSVVLSFQKFRILKYDKNLPQRSA